MAFLNNRRWFLVYAFLFFGLITFGLGALPFTLAPHGKLIKEAFQGAKLALTIIGTVHVYFIARRWQPEVQRAWYARRWYLLAGGLIGFVALLFGLRTFAYQPFDMPSGSMYPSLKIGDAFLVSKSAYRSSQPQRGDIVVFWAEKYQSYFVKRVIGIPADRVQMIGGRLVINGAKMPQRRVEDFSGYCPTGHCELVHQFEESLPGGRTARILDLGPDGPLDNTDVFEVPAEAYFVLGDNRDNSDDSREENVGFVPRGTVIGRVAYKYISGGHWVWQPVD